VLLTQIALVNLERNERDLEKLEEHEKYSILEVELHIWDGRQMIMVVVVVVVMDEVDRHRKNFYVDYFREMKKVVTVRVVPGLRVDYAPG
jgi:hypothetical protein